jgi:hypothetical protein
MKLGLGGLTSPLIANRKHSPAASIQISASNKPATDIKLKRKPRKSIEPTSRTKAPKAPKAGTYNSVWQGAGFIAYQVYCCILLFVRVLTR